MMMLHKYRIILIQQKIIHIWFKGNTQSNDGNGNYKQQK